MRPDGTRVKDLPPLVAAIPYIMPKRYDAWNSVTENIDEEVIKDFIRTHRRAGVRLNHMSVIISAYYKAVLRNPKLNYFVMTGRIYRRNHAEDLSGAGGHGVHREPEDQGRHRRQQGGASVQQHRQICEVHVFRAGAAKICGVAGLSPG